MTHFEMVQILKCKPAALREQSSVTFASPTSRTGCSPFYSRFCSSNYPSKAVILYVQEYLISFLFVLTPLIVSGVIKNRKCRKHNPDNRYCQSLSVFFQFSPEKSLVLPLAGMCLSNAGFIWISCGDTCRGLGCLRERQ